VRRALKALPTLLRIGVAETVAYRAEFLVWILTTTQPLIMMGLWTYATKNEPFQGLTSEDFTGYFLTGLIVRQLTGNWVAWQLMEDIRLGQLSMRLLRPIHPIFAYATSHVAAIPLRTIIALPLCVILLATSGAQSLTHDPVRLAAFVVSIGMAWLITFCVLFAIGSLAFFFTQTMALTTLYFGLFQIFSGYMLPLRLMPRPIQVIADWLPLRAALAVPIDMLWQPRTHAEIAALLGEQVMWTAITMATALGVWKLGVRRFEAVGG
jgi:ABC-2 type transport system permease protein